MLTDPEKTDVRRFCGYPAYGAGVDGFDGWRFYQVYGLLEYRMTNLSCEEESVVRRYLAQLRGSSWQYLGRRTVWIRTRQQSGRAIAVNQKIGCVCWIAGEGGCVDFSACRRDQHWVMAASESWSNFRRRASCEATAFKTGSTGV